MARAQTEDTVVEMPLPSRAATLPSIKRLGKAS